MIRTEFCPQAPCGGANCPIYQADMQSRRAQLIGINASAGSPADPALTQRNLDLALSTRPEIPDGTVFYIHTLAIPDGTASHVALSHA